MNCCERTFGDLLFRRSHHWIVLHEPPKCGLEFRIVIREVARDSAEYILWITLSEVTTKKAIRRAQSLLSVVQSSDRVRDGGLARACNGGKEAHPRRILGGIVENVTNLSDDSLAAPVAGPR